MTIVLGVDESPCSEAAIDYLAKGSWPPETRVIVISVMRPIALAYGGPWGPEIAVPESVFREQREWHQQIAEKAALRLNAAGLKAGARMVEGDARDVLTRAASEAGVSLVVVGSHGRTGVSKLLLGSVATHVVTHAPCNVMVVKTAQN
jgi:nucleotide-binding universal stress UspA family protein